MISFTSRREDGIEKIFHGNTYVGYINENDELYAFTAGRAIHLGSNCTMHEAVQILTDWMKR